MNKRKKENDNTEFFQITVPLSRSTNIEIGKLKLARNRDFKDGKCGAIFCQLYLNDEVDDIDNRTVLIKGCYLPNHISEQIQKILNKHAIDIFDTVQ